MDQDNLDASEKNWLVKSSTRILGPFTLSEVSEQLRSKQISIIDEIRQPDGRWAYIRENPLFMEVVRNVREEQDSASEQTMTQSVAQHTMTRTDALPTLSDDLTPTPIPRASLPTPPKPEYKDVTSSARPPGSKAPFEPMARSYGTANDSRLQEQIRNRAAILRWVMLGTAIVITVVVGVITLKKDKVQFIGYDQLMAQAIRFKNLGLYERSLQAYQQATKLREPDVESQVQMAGVLISEDRQSLMGRRILERAIVQENRTRTEVVEAYLGIAVSYMMDGDLKQAEDTLQKAIGHEPFNISALLNMAIIQFKKGNYQDAMREFDAIYRKHPQSTLALYGKAASAVEYAKNLPDPTFLQGLIRDINSMVQKTGYLRQELLLFLVYSNSLLGDVDGVNQAVVRFLSEMPGQARNYIHPLYVDWRLTQWDYLEKYCTETYKKQTPHPELKALRAICLMEINRDTEAAQILKEALSEAPKDTYVIATQASYLAKVGKLPEAMAMLKLPEISSLPVKNLLLGDICVGTQDLPCAQAAYSQAFTQDNRNALSLFGLAWVMTRSNDRQRAYDYVRAGLQYEPTFLPLLELREQLELE